MLGRSDSRQVQQAAQAAGMDTQAFCDRNCKTFEVRIPGLLQLILTVDVMVDPSESRKPG